MFKCAVANCASSSFTFRKQPPPANLTYHRFPADSKLRKQWLQMCNRDADFDYSRARVCSRHFYENDFLRDLRSELLNQPLKRKLKACAVPLLQLNNNNKKTDRLEALIKASEQIGRMETIVSAQTESDEANSDEQPEPDVHIKQEVIDDYDDTDDPQRVDNDVFESSQSRDYPVPVEPIPIKVLNVDSSSSNQRHSTLPATQDWPGEYDFKIFVCPQEKSSGTISYTYSRNRNKLYVQKDARCPINFSLNSVVSDDVYVRVTAIYSSPEHASDVVQRCINHSMEEMNLGHAEAQHLVRCDSHLSSYQVDDVTGRHSVVVPFENPPAGQHYATYMYKFTCFGSCAGGPNRRPLMLIFTLEKGGNVIGRQKIHVKICACPGRDRKVEEVHFDMEENGKGSKKRKSSDMISFSDVMKFTQGVATPLLKRSRPESTANGAYTIVVGDPECYEFLRQMKKFYNIYKSLKNLPPDFARLLDKQKSSKPYRD